ncbi:MAG: hypothetical protein M3R24_22705 [Chloroflexota bacterium]|nr:hypothetical protein [Chloroflexota bacterium]
MRPLRARSDHAPGPKSAGGWRGGSGGWGLVCPGPGRWWHATSMTELHHEQRCHTHHNACSSLTALDGTARVARRGAGPPDGIRRTLVEHGCQPDRCVKGQASAVTVAPRP